MKRRDLIIVFLYCSALFCTPLLAGDDADEAPGAPAQRYDESVRADGPVAYWRFEGDRESALRSETAMGETAGLTADPVGKIDLQMVGPRPGDYPGFEAGNQAFEINGTGYLRVKDPGRDSPLDFDLGDSITLEAWVNPKSLRGGGFAYIVGKGRTQNPGFDPNNQNYALRLAGGDGAAALAFLFRSAGDNPDWHRWTSEFALPVDGGWHHVAVTYTFGRKDSVRGYVDGESVSGTWDMGGATDRAPVVDDDELWIGSSMGASASTTYQGQIDEVAIYRSALPPERLQARYQYAAPSYEVDVTQLPADRVLVEIFEGIPDKTSWQFRHRKLAASYQTDFFAFVDVPNKYTGRGVKDDWSNPFLLRATGYVTLPPGPRRILVRCRNAARLYLDGRKVAETPFHSIPASGHGQVDELDASLAPNIRPLPRGDSQAVVQIEGDGGRHVLQLEAIIGGRKHRPETGETSVSLASLEGDFHVLGAVASFPLIDPAWVDFRDRQLAELTVLNDARRREASVEETAYWQWRHDLAREILAEQPRVKIPAMSNASSGNNVIDRFLGSRLEEAGRRPAPLADDLSFFRRLCLDVTGTIPAARQIDEFMADAGADRRARWIDRLLASDGWADNWVGYWQDVLAENPNIVNPTLNNTGPFRWWIHESLLANKPFDRMVTELVMMEGSEYFGGPAGFGMATQNDAPMAAKAHIIGQAFLALEMKCARCHDAPYHDFRQRDLFGLAAMLRRAPQEVPSTSSIPGGDEAVKSLLVEVTLKPGESVPPVWSFEDLVPDEVPDGVLRKGDDPRERLAALVTSARNRRFAHVIVNRLWHRYMGRGLVEPVDDWEHSDPSHPELLDYLAEELIAHDYDLKHIARLILNSHAYQRVPRSPDSVSSTSHYLFEAPLQRRMSAEQLVDSLFVATGKPFDAGRMSIDIDGARPYNVSLDLGVPRRAWHFASLSNERDRPSLSLPFVQPFVTLLETFGWRSSRQDPLTVRSQEPTVLQPAILANGTLTGQVTRLTDDSGLTELALIEQPVDSLIDQIYLRLLTRSPLDAERLLFVELLAEGYDQRHIDAPPIEKPRLARGTVSWSNHLHPQANVIKTELEAAVRQGDPPTARLDSDWRQRMEDMVWTLINSPEFVFLP